MCHSCHYHPLAGDNPCLLSWYRALSNFSAPNVSRDRICPSQNWGISKWYSPVFKIVSVAKNSWKIINTIVSFRHKKNAQKFVLGHCLFLKLQRSSSFTLGNCSLLGTDNVCWQNIWEYFYTKWRVLLICQVTDLIKPDFCQIWMVNHTFLVRSSKYIGLVYSCHLFTWLHFVKMWTMDQPNLLDRWLTHTKVVWLSNDTLG